MGAPLRERLHAQREAQLQAKTLALPVTGWQDPQLFVRYRPVEWERLYDLLSPSADAATTLKDTTDALCAACDAILVEVAEGEYPDVDRDERGRVSLADALRAQGEDVRGELTFGENADVTIDALGLKVKDQTGAFREPESAAETCRAVFAGAVSSELAIVEQGAALGAWMRSAGAQIDETLLGG